MLEAKDDREFSDEPQSIRTSESRSRAVLFKRQLHNSTQQSKLGAEHYRHLLREFHSTPNMQPGAGTELTQMLLDLRILRA